LGINGFERKIELINMTKIPFKVSARTARLIGRENVSNADGAVIELVKNGHDADADGVLVVFGKDNDLYIVDNGHGMTNEAILTSWMTIGTDNKELNPHSPNMRVKAGAKGIGRFALDKLGQSVEMFTRPKGLKDGFRWEVNWNDFEKKSIAVDDVQANLEIIPSLDLRGVVAPFKDALDDFESFEFEHGTILHIKDLRDPWTKTSILSLYQNLESLVPSIEDNSFAISVRALDYKGEFGIVDPLINDDFDYRIEARYNSKDRIVSATVIRCELDYLALSGKYAGVFTNPLLKSFPYRKQDYKQPAYSIDIPATELLSGYQGTEEELSGVGDFSFTLNFAKNAAPGGEELKKYPYRNADYFKRKKWLKRFGGIKIYRDNFRVRPYGEMGNDWLQLGERKAASPAGPGQVLNGFRVGPNQIAGSVNISRLSNVALQDKSSREGILENDTFNLFKNLLLEIVSLLENDRSRIFYSLSQFYKDANKSEQTKQAGRDIIARIKKDDENNALPFAEDANTTKQLAAAFEVLEEEVSEQKEENKILRSLASSGLITAAIAHELRGLENILATRNRDLKELITPYIKPADLKNVPDAFNPYVLLSEMEQTDKNLQEWLNYALMPLRKDKRKRRRIFLDEYFKSLKDTWTNLLGERKIILCIDDLEPEYFVKMFNIDLDTIFNNLIINSVESFSRQKNMAERVIEITCEDNAKEYLITYSDNGAGLDSAFAKNPDEIFLPQKTTKRDNVGNIVGTGMGMYLLKSVIEDNNGAARLNMVPEGFSLTVYLQKAE
jgi:signal transduction histidine kinase